MELPQHVPHPIEELRVIGRVGEVRRVVGDHRVVGPAVGVGLGELPAGHRDRQLDVVGRVGGDEVDAIGRQIREDHLGVADPQLQPGRVERPRPARIIRAQVRQLGAESVTLGEGIADHIVVDLSPGRRQLDPQGAPRAAGDRRAEQRPADPRERVQDQLTGPGEELDEPGHQPRRLVGSVPLAPLVAELRGVGGRPDGLGEVQPLLARQLVELVARVGRVAGDRHRSPA